METGTSGSGTEVGVVMLSPTVTGGPGRGKCNERICSMVFVLDTHKKPLMPCTPRRARLLLKQKRAVVHRLSPFTIRLKDREVATCTLQPVVLKIDPGSRISGMALARVVA